MALVLGSPEEQAYELLKKWDADYFLVIFGGVSQFRGDDINKFLWPVRIAQGVYPDLIDEQDYISSKGFRIDDGATEKWKNSLFYKLSLRRVGEITNGIDYARRQSIGDKKIQLTYFEEAFTSKNWMVRIYKLLPPPNRIKWKKTVVTEELSF